MANRLKFWMSQYIVRRYCSQIPQFRMKYLNVAEKNDAAKTIASFLSNGTATRREGCSVYNKIYEFETVVDGKNCKMVMTSVSGHLLQLEFITSYRRWNEVDPQALFSAPVRKACPENNTKIMRTLEREVRSCNGLIIWTDCDREGENIGFEIIDICCKIKPYIKVYRAIFSEITGVSIKRALQQLTQPNKKLSDAVDVRTELDLRTGAAITRFQTMRLQRLFPKKMANKLISYGSCQIPTLGFVAERYKEVEAFVSERFWKIKVLHTIGDLTVDFAWSRNRSFDKAACEDYLLLCLADPKAKVENVTIKSKHKWRPTPLDTVEMEKLGSRKLKISAKETMTIAEKLYSRGIISYPRTETNQFSKDIDLRSIAERFIEHPEWGHFVRRINEWGANPRNGNKTDQAHPPIHPTKLVTDLHGNEARVYELVCRHFLACISKDAIGSETSVHINVAGEKFTATGLCIHQRNYLDIYIYENWNAKQIHKYEQGQSFDPTDILMQEGATTAPPLLTEADLIALMEKHGIGTDATHAEHINTIKERGYIGVVEKGCLVPGIIGMGLYEGYDAMNLALAKPLLRSAFEADLKDICTGKKDPKIVLGEQILKYLEAYKQMTEKITALDNKMALRIDENPTANIDHLVTDKTGHTSAIGKVVNEIFQCPKCLVAPLALRQKKNQDGFYIGCMNFPDCKNVIWLPEDFLEPSVLSETCQHCGPIVKLIKLKFKSLYYKTLFKTPSGWYKTCLLCDRQFCENFNINLEQVKPSGRIIDDASVYTSITASIFPVVTSTTGGIGFEIEAQNGPTSTNFNKNRGKSRTKLKPENKCSSKKTVTTRNVPHFLTPALQSVRESVDVSPKSIENNTLENADAVLADFLNSNDEFDEIMGAVDLPNESVKNTINIKTQKLAILSASTTVKSFTQGNEDTTAVIFDESFPDITEFVWGTAEHRRRSGTNHNYQNMDGAVGIFQQDVNNESPRDVSATKNIECYECHQPAKELKVCKEGPNKGRPFYICPNRNASCNFFKWKNEDSSHD
ncbi:DNA topoisomerase 3-alpha isoform X3 [Eurosta solidaginis]